MRINVTNLYDIKRNYVYQESYSKRKNSYVDNDSKISYMPTFKEVDFLDLAKKPISDKLEEAVKSNKNWMGAGVEGNVFQIPSTKYCIKIPIAFEPKCMHFQRIKISKNVSIQDKINHVVAKLSNGSIIMEKISGVPLGTSMSKNIKQRDNSGEISKMQLKSYIKLLEQIAFAHKNGMVFDSFNYNVIYDKKKDEVTAIDFFEDQCEFGAETRPFQDMYSALTTEYTQKEQQKEIAKKILLAGILEFKPMHKPCLEVYEFDFTEFIQYLRKNGIINIKEDVFRIFNKLCVLKDRELNGNMQDNDYVKIYNKISKIFREI